MISRLSITVLVDNKAHASGCAREHGLSLWVEADGLSLLLDAGQSHTMVVDNAVRTGIDLRRAAWLVLSHGHYDHTGGIGAVLDHNPDVRIVCHEDVFLSRYSRHFDGSMVPVGMSLSASTRLKDHAHLHLIDTPLWITDDIGVTGPIPRDSRFEDTGGDFFLDYGAQHPDPLHDDLALWVKTTRGLCVVCGCCHAGVVNTLAVAAGLTGVENVYAVVGGMHLLHASSKRIKATVAALKEKKIRYVVPLHCTGETFSRHGAVCQWQLPSEGAVYRVV